jgi:uncharacterized protein YajQ (UPF0234 family)
LASTSSFDVTTGVDYMEVHNAVDQTTKEITQRYDFKGLKVSVELNEKDKKITLAAPDDYKLKAIWDVLQSKLVRRQVPLKNMKPGEAIAAAGATMRQEIAIQDGLTSEMARDIVRTLEGCQAEARPVRDPGRHGAGQLAQQGRPAGGHPPAQVGGLRRRAEIRQLPHQLKRLWLRPITPGRRPRRAPWSAAPGAAALGDDVHEARRQPAWRDARRADGRDRDLQHPHGDRDPELHPAHGSRREGAVKSNMSTLQLAAEDYAVQNQGVYSSTLDGTHIGNQLPQSFSNPYSGGHGSGDAYEDRLYLYEAPSATPGIVSYADSVTSTYNIKGAARQGPLHLVLASGH